MNIKSDSSIEEIRRELAALRLAHEALLASYKKLALRVLGDNPETHEFLEEINSHITKNYPQWMK